MNEGTETRLSYELWQRRMTQADLARAAGIDPGVISKLVCGVMKPYPGYASKIAAAIDWRGDPAKLFEEVGKDEQHV